MPNKPTKPVSIDVSAFEHRDTGESTNFNPKTTDCLQQQTVYNDKLGVVMQIQSTRFGKLEISHSDLIFMPHGLIGFEDYRHWILLASADSEEVAWLQSVALPNVALPMISPRRFIPEYRLHVQRRDLDVLQMHARDKVFVLSILNKSGKHWTTNLKSPIIMNSTRRLAVQVILTDDQPLSQPIILADEQALQQVA